MSHFRYSRPATICHVYTQLCNRQRVCNNILVEYVKPWLFSWQLFVHCVNHNMDRHRMERNSNNSLRLTGRIVTKHKHSPTIAASWIALSFLTTLQDVIYGEQWNLKHDFFNSQTRYNFQMTLHIHCIISCRPEWQQWALCWFLAWAR